MSDQPPLLQVRRRAGRRGRLAVAVLAAVSLQSAPAPGADWPQFLGPARNGSLSGDDVAAAWPANGPRIVWQKKIGAGFAAPVVAGGKLVLFHRLGDKEIVEALDATNGAPCWKFEYATAYRDDFGFDPGPRATPAIASGRVFTYGAESVLHCLDLSAGRALWSVDCRKAFGADKGFFGPACSPLVEGENVILILGGREGAGVVAFDAQTGAVRWRAVNDQASYSSPVIATLGDRRVVLAITRGLFTGLDAASGRTLFQRPYRPPQHASVTGATPLVVGNQMFLSAAYDLGALMLHFEAGALREVWSGDDRLSLQYSTPVFKDGHLYGLHGRHDFPGGTELRCVEWATGAVRWRKGGLNGANVTLAGSALLILTENGELVRAAAKPDQFRELGRVQILGRGVRAYPALARGRLYARGKDALVCVALADP
jgi:outer membrane protein assembly factor BamB